MCGHGGERMVKVWVLNYKGKKTSVTFLVDEYEPETNTEYQFMSLAWAYMFKESYKKTTKVIYKDLCQIDRLIKNNGWDRKNNLVSTWKCEEPILKKEWFEKEFTLYLQFLVHDFKAILAPLNTNKRCHS